MVEQTIGEDMAAIEIGGELNLVDGDEINGKVARHRLDRADPEARPFRLDLLLAGDERDGVGPDLVDHALIDLARQQAQRQADHAGGMRDHPLDREMGLAGIGRSEHCRDAASAERRRKGTGLNQDAGAFLQPARRNAEPALTG